MYGRKERKRPLQQAQIEQLENLRDDCIALFLNSGLRQKDIWERGGPTPQTISKWLYKETFFPRYDTLERFLMVLGYSLTPMPVKVIADYRTQPVSQRLNLKTGNVVALPEKKAKRA